MNICQRLNAEHLSLVRFPNFSAMIIITVQCKYYLINNNSQTYLLQPNVSFINSGYFQIILDRKYNIKCNHNTSYDKYLGHLSSGPKSVVLGTIQTFLFHLGTFTPHMTFASRLCTAVQDICQSVDF